MRKKVLITGSNGQLGTSLLQLKPLLDINFEAIFADRSVFPLDDISVMQAYLDEVKPAFIVNCAAYTAVDKAESEPALAIQINGLAPRLMARWCATNQARLIHVSTDYVFDGTSSIPLKEDAPTGAINMYGSSKRLGEEAILQAAPESIIIRTSWVYAPFGANFVKTMMRLMNERAELNVVNDQIGAPTYAPDLAKLILVVLEKLYAGKGESTGGIYHFCNQGKISWFDFAQAIRDKAGFSTVVHPIPSSAYPTPAKRPAFSLMNCDKVCQVFDVRLVPWQDSLDDCLLMLASPIA